MAFTVLGVHLIHVRLCTNLIIIAYLSMPQSNKPVPFLIGISGPSCSGKTTLSRVLKDVLPNALVVHEDDFYKTDSAIPIKNGVQDWDCSESINLPLLVSTLRNYKDTGIIESNFRHEEDNEMEVPELKDLQSVIASHHSSFKELLRRLEEGGNGITSIVIVEGFLLYSEELKPVRDLMDVKIFLRVDYQTMKERRENRNGYTTIEGFWEDPPGYVDDVVWPNYVEDHAFLFEGGDVQGVVDGEVCKRLRIQIMPQSAATDIRGLTEWACGIIKAEMINIGR